MHGDENNVKFLLSLLIYCLKNLTKKEPNSESSRGSISKKDKISFPCR